MQFSILYLQSILLHYNSTLRSAILRIGMHPPTDGVFITIAVIAHHCHTKVFHISTIISTMTTAPTTSRNIPAPLSSVVSLSSTSTPPRQQHQHHSSSSLSMCPHQHHHHYLWRCCLWKNIRVLYSLQWMLSRET